MKARELWEPTLAPLEAQPHYCLYDSPVLPLFKDQTKASIQLCSLTPQSFVQSPGHSSQTCQPGPRASRLEPPFPTALLSSSKHFLAFPALPSLIQLLCQFSICASLSLRPAPHNCGNVCWCSERKPFSSIPLYTSQSSSTGIRGLMLPCGHKFPYHPVLKHGRSWQRRGLGFNPGNSLGSLGRLWHWPGQAWTCLTTLNSLLTHWIRADCERPLPNSSGM